METLFHILNIFCAFALRFGVPLAIMAGLTIILTRVDRRWSDEARSKQRDRSPGQRIPGVAHPHGLAQGRSGRVGNRIGR